MQTLCLCLCVLTLYHRSWRSHTSAEAPHWSTSVPAAQLHWHQVDHTHMNGWLQEGTKKEKRIEWVRCPNPQTAQLVCPPAPHQPSENSAQLFCMSQLQSDRKPQSTPKRRWSTFATNTVGSPVVGEQVGRVRSSNNQMLHVSPGQVFTGTRVDG